MSAVREAAIDAVLTVKFGERWRAWGNPDAGWLPRYVESSGRTLARERFRAGESVDAVLGVVEASQDVGGAR